MAASRNKPATELAGHLAAWLASAVPAGAPLWVGLSGGRDSVVLLHALRTILPAGRLFALHVHHGLAPEADAWADFCVRLCRAWDIACVVRRVCVDQAAADGLEAAARRARYAAYRDSGAQHLALAHHARDQAETLLFRLCRGAGVAGAAAMPPVRREGPLTLYRPLLDCDVALITAHAAAHGLDWIEDASNAELRHSRNFLRSAVFPVLRQRFPAIDRTLARAARHFAEARMLLAERAAEDEIRIQSRRAPLLTLSPARQANWLRHWLTTRGWRPPASEHLHEALRQLAVARADGDFRWHLPEGDVRLWRGRLHAVPACLPAVPERCAWDAVTPLSWGGGVLLLAAAPGRGLDRARLAGRNLVVRPRKGGEALRPGANRPLRPLKKLLQENAVPPWQRTLWPLIYVDDELIACPGIAVAADWQCAPAETGAWPVWQPPTF
jgi:tRNA(Ile)-lysidine synthase